MSRSYKYLGTSTNYLMVTVYALGCVFPLLWMFITSFRTTRDAYRIPPTWLPKEITLDNFINIFGKGNFGAYTINSLFVATSVTLICLVLGLIAAYGFSRYKVKGLPIFLGLIIASRMVPPPTLVMPFFILSRQFGILDTKFVLILADVYLQLPLFIWMAKDFIDDVPVELDEAAMMDGCSRLHVLWRIVAPAGSAGIIAVSILTFLFTWNDLLFPITLASSAASKTITVGITDFVTDADMLWTRMAAAGVIGALPSLIFVMLCQKYLIKGLLQGALKG